MLFRTAKIHGNSNQECGLDVLIVFEQRYLVVIVQFHVQEKED